MLFIESVILLVISSTKNYLLPKDMILLKLLKELLDDNSECVETSMEKLTVLEEQYFRERLLRKE